ncbi:hypothetical protein JEQ21_06410 [Streptococcus sp. 121]|uniref:hypothetical protein n=1 Tax=Streptococcus sp. 121 TaxID=2797637 RepID=UPI0018F0E032|nr:hypothetical protein [Streptococcus sp. 121]MBJ6746088.1 hypothetical protein [Streptococcus sp. 121]
MIKSTCELRKYFHTLFIISLILVTLFFRFCMNKMMDNWFELIVFVSVFVISKFLIYCHQKETNKTKLRNSFLALYFITFIFLELLLMILILLILGTSMDSTDIINIIIFCISVVLLSFYEDWRLMNKDDSEVMSELLFFCTFFVFFLIFTFLSPEYSTQISVFISLMAFLLTPESLEHLVDVRIKGTSMILLTQIKVGLYYIILLNYILSNFISVPTNCPILLKPIEKFNQVMLTGAYRFIIASIITLAAYLIYMCLLKKRVQKYLGVSEYLSQINGKWKVGSRTSPLFILTIDGNKVTYNTEFISSMSGYAIFLKNDFMRLTDKGHVLNADDKVIGTFSIRDDNQSLVFYFDNNEFYKLIRQEA